MSFLDIKNIVECQTCGNRDGSRIAERDGGYVCKCCGVWYKSNPTEEEFREQMRCEQGYAQLRAYRFGDARDTFQIILQNNPDNINALWGLLLSRFGVVYIKGFYKGVVEPIYCFPNYDRMKRRYMQSEPEFSKIMDLLKNDAELRFEYEKKAENIDDALDSFKEYKASTDRDVFICVKISAATERNPEAQGRTKDYEFALKVYNELKRRGINAFYSFVTLQNDVKSDEKIWRNLVKSKKMLIIGSSEEYLESPWVKSEWKRWLHLKREEDMYVCVLHNYNESPFDILPQEISDLEPQIYTQNTYEKLIEHICDSCSAEVVRQTAKPAPETEIKFVPEAKPKVEPEPVTEPALENLDGKIIYTDGREEVLKYGLTEIKKEAYKYNKDVFSVVLPKSVTAIGDSAFAFCRSLSDITIGENVREIGKNPFASCKVKINLSPRNKQFKVVDNNLYSSDEKKIIAYIPKENEEEFSIPGRVTLIADSAFKNCENLTAITIPEGVTSIKESAFYGCGRLADVKVPNGVTSIGDWAFAYCKSLAGFTIPDGMTLIANSAFKDCENLTDITIPSSVNAIDGWAFAKCINLKEIYYGGSKADWKKIKISKYGNEKLLSLFGKANIHYNSI